jgi:hypothetical protein
MATRLTEGLGAGIAVSLLGLLLPADPAFAGLCFLPQVLVSVTAAALLGAAPGFLSLAGAALAVAAIPLAARLLGLRLAFPEAQGLLESARLPAAAALAGVIAAGGTRDAYERSNRHLFGRLRDISHRDAQIKKMNAALATLSDELERRISGQRDSVSSLYARVRKMDSYDLDAVLSGLLEAIAAFSQASSAVVYEYDHESDRLVRKAFLGGDLGIEGELSPEGSLEGWVFRNDRTFSLRNVGDYLNIARVDYKSSVLAFPIKSGDLPWGVLNIREMPFYRYNPITENNLRIVVELAASYVKKAVDFRDRVLARPRNEITGLPGFGELLRVLGEEIEKRRERRIAVSVVIVELLGFDEFVFARPGREAFLLLKSFASAATSGVRAVAFHAREDGQLAFVLPDIDRDGASLFCLGLSEVAGSRQWRADDDKACIDIAFGLASFPPSPAAAGSGPGAASGPEALIAEAESVLALSRGAYAEHGSHRP